MEALLATGQWQQWREALARPAACSAAAAVSWCASRHWRRHEPNLEDWVQIVRDLDGRLSDADRAGMTDTERRPSPFPPIAWFESGQQADLDALANTAKIANHAPIAIHEPQAGSWEAPDDPADSGAGFDIATEPAAPGPDHSRPEATRRFEPPPQRAKAPESTNAPELPGPPNRPTSPSRPTPTIPPGSSNCG